MLLDVEEYPLSQVIMSSFRRSASAKKPSALAGAKPFLNGQTLVSTGLSQLDALLGGGLLLGTLMLLDVPRNDAPAAAASQALVDDLHRYFLGEALVSGQCALLVAEDAAEFVRYQLPLELSLAQKQVKQQQQSQGDDAAQLTIAWQYGKYLAADSASASASSRFCHSFDLSKPMHQAMLEANPPMTLDLLHYLRGQEGVQVYTRLLADIEAEVARRKALPQVMRISIRSLGSPLIASAMDLNHMRALISFLRRLAALAASQPVVCMLSGPLFCLPAELVTELRHICDYVVETKSFMGEKALLPPELSEFDGMLELCKLARVHSLACHSVDAVKYGLKRERRKLKIEKFHLPPEGSRASSSDTKSSSRLVASSSSSVGCGGGSHATGVDPLAF